MRHAPTQKVVPCPRIYTCKELSTTPALHEVIDKVEPGQLQHVWVIDANTGEVAEERSWHVLPKQIAFAVEREFFRWMKAECFQARDDLNRIGESPQSRPSFSTEQNTDSTKRKDMLMNVGPKKMASK